MESGLIKFHRMQAMQDNIENKKNLYIRIRKICYNPSIKKKMAIDKIISCKKNSLI